MPSLDAADRQALAKALNSAIPTGDTLEEFVGMQFGILIDQITEPKPVGVMILRVIRWSESQGKVAELLQAALESFSGNQTVSGTLPPLLEKLRNGEAPSAADRTRIQQTEALDLGQLTANLADLVHVLQQLAPTADANMARQALEAGARAVGKVKEHGGTKDLTEDERTGLDTILFATSRPALLVQNGDFSTPPEQWRMLIEHRAALQRAIAATGRMEMPNHVFPWVGTGFLAAPNVVATASYVGTVAAKRESGKWVLNRKIGARINFLQEFGATGSQTFTLKSVIGADDKLGIMLFEVSGKGLPAPIPLAGPAQPPPGQAVCLVGYPAEDARRPDDFMRAVLGNIYGVKRLCPGKVMRVDDEAVVEHDCSSSSGTGGGPVVDTTSGEVLGVHYSARYLEAGYARRLALLKGTKLARTAGLF